MPPKKRPRAAAAPAPGVGGRRGVRDRGAREDEDADDGDAGAASDSDDDRGGGGAAMAAADEEEEDAEAAETATEKRLRLAKAYLTNLRTELAADKARKRSALSDEDEDGEGEGEEGEEGEGDGGLGARLATDASLARGERQRELAGRVSAPAAGAGGVAAAGTLWRGHKLSVTALALSEDDATAWSASKDGALLRWDVETGARSRLPQPPPVPTKSGPCAPPRSGAATVLALAVSSDGALLASAGTDRHVHVWDTRAPPDSAHVRAFPGHRDAVTCLAFRPGARTLFSGAADRCVKIWALDDMAYVDTLFGHSNEVLAIAASRRERALTVGRDRTCRLWKVSEDSQLVFHAASTVGSLESAAFVGANEWVSGAADGSLARWSAMKKKPAGVWHAAHGPVPSAPPAEAEGGAARKAGGWGAGRGSAAAALHAARAAAGTPQEPLGAAASWVGAVASARGTDLVASGAADGAVRLWRVGAGEFSIEPRAALPARGFVNALAVARSGRFVLAGMGQEPRLGRWARDAGARNGVLMHTLAVADAAEEET